MHIVAVKSRIGKSTKVNLQERAGEVLESLVGAA